MLQIEGQIYNDQTMYNQENDFTHNELMDKFNLAFYEAQDIFSKTENFSNNLDQIEISDIETNTFSDFNIDDFIKETNKICESESDNFTQHSNESLLSNFFEHFGANDGFNDDDDGFYNDLTQFLIQPSNNDNSIAEIINNDECVNNHFDYNNIHHIDYDDSVSNRSLDEISSHLAKYSNTDYKILPSITTITKDNLDFNYFLRTVPENDIGCFTENNYNNNEFGHLIGVQNNNNYQEENNINVVSQKIENTNCIVLKQSEALLNDDPLLSSSSLIYPADHQQQISIVANKTENECVVVTDCSETEMKNFINYQCKWEQCYQIYESQLLLVKHIEKCHVELKRGEEFTCFWENCPRKIKPFNARYKLLIHMRVHSGEKPNKCPFKGCSKAFSRLENLKIHQRSHTGERPYLCQFSSCTKSFSNSSDRAKHQRTHFDTKPYACQVIGCNKKYTDPSSLRKHVKNHTLTEQMQIKKKTLDDNNCQNSKQAVLAKKYFDPLKQKAVRYHNNQYYTKIEHNYYNKYRDNSSVVSNKKYDSISIKEDLKNKISEKNKLKKCFNVVAI